MSSRDRGQRAGAGGGSGPGPSARDAARPGAPEGLVRCHAAIALAACLAACLACLAAAALLEASVKTYRARVLTPQRVALGPAEGAFVARCAFRTSNLVVPHRTFVQPVRLALELTKLVRELAVPMLPKPLADAFVGIGALDGIAHLGQRHGAQPCPKRGSTPAALRAVRGRAPFRTRARRCPFSWRPRARLWLPEGELVGWFKVIDKGVRSARVGLFASEGQYQQW